ncbi:MAG: hypothetical protein SFU86_13855 [Pirellulaceae bacterium]|nr:hypothetical protein [Pirellulaceae bacterium]
MTIATDIQRELNRIQAVTGRGLLQVDVAAGRVEADLVGVDAIGCSFQTLGYITTELADASLDRLKEISDALTKKLTYLLEPIGLIEADADRCAVQLRSSPPKKDEDGASYYELLVRRGGDITLSRYAKKPGQMRQIVPAHVTREVLARLADDFVAAVF